MTWELRDKAPVDETKIKFEVEFGDIFGVAPGWFLSDGGAQFEILQRDTLEGKTLREGSNGTIPSLAGWFVLADDGSTFTFDSIGKRLSILNSSIESNNGVYEIKEIKKVSGIFGLTYRAAIISQDGVEPILIPDSGPISWAILDTPKLTLSGLASGLKGIREQYGYDATTTVSGAVLDIYAPSATFDFTNQTDVGKYITVRCSLANMPSEFTAEVTSVIDINTVRVAAPSWWATDSDPQEWELRTKTAVEGVATYASLTVPGAVSDDGNVTYTANYAGAPGNTIQVVHQLGALGVTVSTLGSFQQIVVNVGTPFPDTSANIVLAVNGDPSASALVTATAGGTGTGLVGLTAAAEPLTGGVEVTQLQVHPPSLLSLLAKDAGIEIDIRETEERQRNWVRHVSDWNKIKGNENAYKIVGRISGYYVTPYALFRVTQEVADKIGSLSGDLYEVSEYAYGRSYPSPSSSTSPEQGGRLTTGSGGRIQFQAPAAAFKFSDIGCQIRISNADNPSNEKLYTIDQYVDPNTVLFRAIDSAIVPDHAAGEFKLYWAITRLYTTKANSQPRFDDMDPIEMGDLINCSRLRLNGVTSPDGDVVYRAIAAGTGGDSIKIEHVTDISLSILVSGTQITVGIVTGSTTAAAVAAAVNADPSASALVEATASGTGLGVVATASLTNLVGGGDYFGIDRYCWEEDFSSVVLSPYFYLTAKTIISENVFELTIVGPMDVVRDVSGGNWRITDLSGSGTDFYLDTDYLPVAAYTPPTPPTYKVRVFSSIEPTLGLVTLTYDCSEIYSCDFCKSNKLLAHIEIGDLINDPGSSLESAQTRILDRIEQVKPAHVELLPVFMATLSASLTLSAEIRDT